MSERITVDIPHGLGVTEAKRRIQHGFARLAAEIGGPALVAVKSAWEGDRMTFSVALLGQALSGQLQVMSDLVRIDVQLPGLLAGFAGGIRAKLKAGAQVLLEKK